MCVEEGGMWSEFVFYVFELIVGRLFGFGEEAPLYITVGSYKNKSELTETTYAMQVLFIMYKWFVLWVVFF